MTEIEQRIADIKAREQTALTRAHEDIKFLLAEINRQKKQIDILKLFRWIPITERLPKDGDRVLVLVKDITYECDFCAMIDGLTEMWVTRNKPSRIFYKSDITYWTLSTRPQTEQEAQRP